MPSFWPLLPLSVFILERVRSGTTSSLKLKYVAKPGGNICFTVSISYFILRRLFLNLIAFISDAMRSLQFTTFERRWHGKVCLIYLVGWKRLYLKLCFLYNCYPPSPLFATVHAAFLVSRCGHAAVSHSAVFRLRNLALEKRRHCLFERIHSWFISVQRRTICFR